MLGLPKTTEFNKRIPKQKFYENINITPALRRIFVEQIKVVYWRNKIAPTTINLEAGNNVTISFSCWNSKKNTRLGLRIKKRQGVAPMPSRLTHIIIQRGFLRMSLF